MLRESEVHALPVELGPAKDVAVEEWDKVESREHADGRSSTAR
jgi:hypothetical protein